MTQLLQFIKKQKVRSLKKKKKLNKKFLSKSAFATILIIDM